jgi:iron complex transport system substrate-binding protein
MLLLGFAILAGCATGAGPTPSGSPVEPIPTSSPTSSAAASPPTAIFPVTLSDDEGTAVAIPAEPRRIVSLTPGATEVLFALGVGDRVVAADSASDYPPEAAPLPHVAAFGTLDAEQVVADVELLGRVVGRPAAGVGLAQTMRSAIDGLALAVRAGPKPRVFYEVDATKQIYGPADQSFLAEMVALAGGEPVTSGSADNFEIPLERLVAADPEVIILGDAAFGANADVVTKRSGWDVMTAVRKGAIRPVDDKLVTRPGPRLADGLRSLILAIHPDARLP